MGDWNIKIPELDIEWWTDCLQEEARYSKWIKANENIKKCLLKLEASRKTKLKQLDDVKIHELWGTAAQEMEEVLLKSRNELAEALKKLEKESKQSQAYKDLEHLSWMINELYTKAKLELSEFKEAKKKKLEVKLDLGYWEELVKKNSKYTQLVKNNEGILKGLRQLEEGRKAAKKRETNSNGYNLWASASSEIFNILSEARGELDKKVEKLEKNSKKDEKIKQQYQEAAELLRIIEALRDKASNENRESNDQMQNQLLTTKSKTVQDKYDKKEKI